MPSKREKATAAEYRNGNSTTSDARPSTCQNRETQPVQVMTTCHAKVLELLSKTRNMYEHENRSDLSLKLGFVTSKENPPLLCIFLLCSAALPLLDSCRALKKGSWTVVFTCWPSLLGSLLCLQLLIMLEEQLFKLRCHHCISLSSSVGTCACLHFIEQPIETPLSLK